MGNALVRFTSIVVLPGSVKLEQRAKSLNVEALLIMAIRTIYPLMSATNHPKNDKGSATRLKAGQIRQIRKSADQ